MPGHVYQHAAADHRRYQMSAQFCQTGDVRKVRPLIAVIEVAALAHVPQPIQLRTGAEPHLHQIIVGTEVPAVDFVGIDIELLTRLYDLELRISRWVSRHAWFNNDTQTMAFAFFHQTCRQSNLLGCHVIGGADLIVRPPF